MGDFEKFLDTVTKNVQQRFTQIGDLSKKGEACGTLLFFRVWEKRLKNRDLLPKPAFSFCVFASNM